LDNYDDIELRQAVELHKNGNVLFVDARLSEDYVEGHIKGAVSLPVNDFNSHISLFRKEYPDSMTIVTYCSGRECSDSHDLAELLARFGYFRTFVFLDGYPAWKEAGLPVATAEMPVEVEK
jgi:rhodanese-related sulfurtransferase